MAHWQKLRDERKETYLAFLAALEDFQAEIAILRTALQRAPTEHSHSALSEVRQTAGDRLTALYRQSSRVGLAGPTAMSDLANEIRVDATWAFARLDDHVREGTEPTPESVRTYLQKVSHLIEQNRRFIREAEQLLQREPPQ
ncbi:hypothetical protein ACWEDZ_15435 [Streptomyces sp. NPDC005047]